MKNYRNLEVWQRGHRITLKMYRSTASFPKWELFGLVSQIRRCSASIPANIAEGCGRKGGGEFHRFLEIASGSASELDYHLLLARELGYLSKESYDEAIDELGRLRRQLTTLIGKVNTDRLTAKSQSPTAKC